MATNSAYSGFLDELKKIVPQITREIEKGIEKPSDKSRNRSRREYDEYNRGYEKSHSGEYRYDYDNKDGIKLISTINRDVIGHIRLLASDGGADKRTNKSISHLPGKYFFLAYIKHYPEILEDERAVLKYFEFFYEKEFFALRGAKTFERKRIISEWRDRIKTESASAPETFQFFLQSSISGRGYDFEQHFFPVDIIIGYKYKMGIPCSIYRSIPITTDKQFILRKLSFSESEAEKFLKEYSDQRENVDIFISFTMTLKGKSKGGGLTARVDNFRGHTSKVEQNGSSSHRPKVGSVFREWSLESPGDAVVKASDQSHFKPETPSSNVVATDGVVTGRVVWATKAIRGNRYCGISIYDGTSTTEIINNLYSVELPQINNSGQVVWSSYTDYSDNENFLSVNEIFLYNGTSVTNISNNSGFNDDSPQINDSGQVVWVGNYNVDGGYSEIFLYDGTSVTNISNNSGFNDHSPQINDAGQVVWSSNTDYGINEIFLYNGTSVTNISNNSNTKNLWPQINNSGQVVWSNGKGIFLYNGTLPATIIGSGSWRPQINNSGQVVWSNGKEIFLYNGTSVTNISNNSNVTFLGLPQINNAGHVVWHGYDGTDNEIYLYDGTSVIQLTNNSYQDSKPQINNLGQVVWLGGKRSKDKQVFFYDGTSVTQLTNNSDMHYTSPQINYAGTSVTQLTNNSDMNSSPQINYAVRAEGGACPKRTITYQHEVWECEMNGYICQEKTCASYGKCISIPECRDPSHGGDTYTVSTKKDWSKIDFKCTGCGKVYGEPGTGHKIDKKMYYPKLLDPGNCHDCGKPLETVCQESGTCPHVLPNWTE
jgi:hypothetical protein